MSPVAYCLTSPDILSRCRSKSISLVNFLSHMIFTSPFVPPSVIASRQPCTVMIQLGPCDTTAPLACISSRVRLNSSSTSSGPRMGTTHSSDGKDVPLPTPAIPSLDPLSKVLTPVLWKETCISPAQTSISGHAMPSLSHLKQWRYVLSGPLHVLF